MELAYSTPEVEQLAKTVAEAVSEKMTLGKVPSEIGKIHFGQYEVKYWSPRSESMNTCFLIQEGWEHRKETGKLTFKFNGIYMQDGDLRTITLKEKNEPISKLVERVSKKVLERYQVEAASVNRQREKTQQQNDTHKTLRSLKDEVPEYAKFLSTSVNPQKLEFTVNLTVDDMRYFLSALRVGGFAVPEDSD